jgi:hypothetical protein
MSHGANNNMTNSLSSESCPIIGPNTHGTISSCKSILTVEYVTLAGVIYARDPNNKQYITHMSEFQPLPNIPSRFREYNWIMLAPYWAKALEVYPKAVVIRPSGISFETLARKLRESRFAKDKYGYLSPLIDESRWASLADKLLITPLDTGNVQIGPFQPKDLIAFEAALTSRNQILIRCQNPSAVESFCNLVSQRVFDPKPSFVMFGLDPTTIESLEERYDVGFVAREDGKSWEVVF